MKKPDLYAQDGVNVQVGDDFSAHAGRVCRDSFGNSVFVQVNDPSGYFRGSRSLRLHSLPPNYELGMTSDGNGTKVVLNAAAEMYREAAYDLLAMSSTDLVREGGIGLAFNNVLDTSTLGDVGTPTHQAFIELINGLGTAAAEIGVVLFRGETAELGPCVSSENPESGVKFNWSGTMLGAIDNRRRITGENVSAGMVIIALRECGFRANGISSVRKALAMRFGVEWWANPEAQEYIKMAAEPSKLYDPFLNYLNGWYYSKFERPITAHSIIHLSGGALEGKLGNDLLFRLGLSAELDNLCEPPEIMRLCADWRGMDDEDCYKTWNGGQGALVIVSPEDVTFFLREAERYEIAARVCGQITKEDEPRIRLQSKFSGAEIIYSPS